MDAWDFFVPSIGLFIGLNIITCCVGIRRMRLIERRVHLLEERQTTPAEATTVTATAVPYTTMPTYVQAPTYSYYQQPSAPTQVYYPQDPQNLGRTY